MNSEWVHITSGIPDNIPVSSIVFDPNDKKTFYVGTGESYTGQALKWTLKSSDGGITWNNVFENLRLKRYIEVKETSLK